MGISAFLLPAMQRPRRRAFAALGFRLGLVRQRSAAQHVEDVGRAEAEHHGIGQHVDAQRQRHAGPVDIADRVGGTQLPVHHPGLAPDLGDEPAGKDGDETRRQHQVPCAMQVAGRGQPPLTPAHAGGHGQQQHRHADPDHDAERVEHRRHRRQVLRRRCVQCVDLPVPGVGQDQAAQARDRDLLAVAGGGLVGHRPQHQRHALALRQPFPVALHRGHLQRLMLGRVQPMQVACQDLQRHHDQGERSRQAQHADRRLHVHALAQVPARHASDHEAGGQEGSQGHVRQAIRERWVEDHLAPRGDVEDSVHQFHALGRVHPAVGRQDPERGQQRAQRHHAGREEMQPLGDALPAEQHHAEERGLEEERSQHFEAEQRPDHRARTLGEHRPVGADLEAHHDAAHHAHAERHGEDLQPEEIQVLPHRVARAQPAVLQEGQPARQPDRERREQDMETDDEAELDSRQKQGVHDCRVSPT
jgi:hypothetical protein